VYSTDSEGELILRDTPNLDAPIIAMTENYLMTSNGKLYYFDYTTFSSSDGTTLYQDDFSNPDWYLDGVSTDTMIMGMTSSFDYLTDNSTMIDYLSYMGVSTSVRSEDTYPDGFCFYDGYWWMIGRMNRMIYKYDPDWTYTGISYPYGAGGSGAYFAGDIEYYNGKWYLCGSTLYGVNKVWEYNLDWTWTGALWSVSGFPDGIHHYDGFWWVIRYWPGGGSDVRKYNDAWVYQAVSYSLTSEDGYMHDLLHYDGFWWTIGETGDNIYQYNDTWDYTGNSYDVIENIPEAFAFRSPYWYVLGFSSDTVFVYDNIFRVGKSNNKSISGYIYMQTDQTETVSLKSPTYSPIDLAINTR
ncbi:hypothetical protein LCGC14_3055610, partial [marine sediment metagenome]